MGGGAAAVRSGDSLPQSLSAKPLVCWAVMGLGKALLVLILGIEGLLLLSPDGALVRAARHEEHRAADLPAYWWRKSPVHMGCSVARCSRPATRTATYRQLGPRGTTWRAYGFCEFHNPPEHLNGLVYRPGQPPRPGYDVPLRPLWAEIYFLLGVFAFGIWCAVMWGYASSKPSAAVQAGLFLLHATAIAGLWLF